MRVAVVGAGAVGGYYGAMLARAGHDVTVVARGAHLAAIRSRGLTVRAARGEFTVRPAAVDAPFEVGPTDVVLFAVKTYDNDTALPMLRPLVRPETIVLRCRTASRAQRRPPRSSVALTCSAGPRTSPLRSRRRE
jgi:2-dehydropantoate 2-reductase